MRVMQIMAGSKFGGAETFYERLVTALHASGLEQQAVIRRQAERAERLKASGLAVRQLAFGGVFDVLTTLRIGHAIKAWRPDVVLTWMNRATSKTPKSAAVWCGRLGGYYDLKYYHRCDHLIGNTADIVDYIRGQGWPKERTHFLPNFVSAVRKAPIPRAAFDTPERVPLLLALGRLHANKAFDTLIRALANVPEAYLWLAGVGPEEEALRRLAKERGVDGRVRFLGWQTDTAPLFAASDIFVCPSRHEPLGNVVIEAFAQERPVIAAASQGPKALIDHEVNGLLVPIDDVDALTCAIAATIADPLGSAALARAGNATYVARFTEESVVIAYRAFFDKIARR